VTVLVGGYTRSRRVQCEETSLVFVVFKD
jgi:hypothetical protein